MRIERAESFLLAVDLQEKLVPAVDRPERVVANTSTLMRAAALLDVPVILTEHCADRIGHTVPPLAELAPPDAVLAKTHFSAQAEPDGAARFKALGRCRPVVCGTEAHVCVLQTTLDLKAAGYAPCLVADAVASRHPGNRDAAIARMRDAGIEIATVEMILFEWLERGDSDAFRTLLPLIKDLGEPFPDRPREAE